MVINALIVEHFGLIKKGDKYMAVVAVNKDGTEVIGNSLVRCVYDKHYWLAPAGYYNLTKEQTEFWCDVYDDPDEGLRDVSIELPKGSIKKLIGRELTWDDEPVELK